MHCVLVLTLTALLESLDVPATQKQIDQDRSSLTIHDGKTGFLAASGHDHAVSAPIKHGSVNEGQPSRVSFSVEAARLVVLPEEHQAEIQHSMQEKVLESVRSPEITFVSDSVQPSGEDHWVILGELSLHGVTKRIQVSVRRVDGGYRGASMIKQTDFGIQPISAAGGTVRVKDELKIDFIIITK